jgi:tetratricopeptide (TPR) repeat protein
VPSDELKTFALVPLVADFLRKKKPGVVAETGDRLEKHAYALVVENGYIKYDRFPVLDTEWPTVAAALPRFLTGPNSQLQTVCEALATFLEFTGRWDERLALDRDAEYRAVAIKDFSNAGWRAYKAGWIHYLRRQSADVIACADSAEVHWRNGETGKREQALAMRLRGLGHQLAKNYVAAIAAHREVVEIFRSLGHDSEEVGMALNSLGSAEKDFGDLESAERDFREALRIARVVDDREGIATYTGNLVILALARKDWPMAETLAREALSLSERIGRQELIAFDSRRLAKALVRQARKAEALPHARRAVEIFTKLDSPFLSDAQELLAECES